MLDAVIKAWPVFAFFVVTTGSLLTWIGLGVWNIAQWTKKHDLQAEATEARLTAVEVRIDTVENKVNELQIATAKLSVRP